MNVAVLIILIIVGGIILWGALTGWTFSGIFGDAKGDSPPTPITNVQVGVSTGESGGRRESYRTVEEMMGLSITISFNTPSSFGFGTLALKDYVISLGTAGSNGTRRTLLAVIIIPRRAAAVGTRLMTGSSNMTPGGITLTGNFDARDEEVSITISDPLWEQGNFYFPEGDVFLGIDYTPMGTVEDRVYIWGQATADNPAGNDTKKFISGGVTLIGEVKDDAGFVVNPDVTESINEQLNIAVVADNIGGEKYITKQIPKSSRFLISPFFRQDLFLGFPIFLTDNQGRGYGYGMKGTFNGRPMDECILDAFRGTPTNEADSFVDFDKSNISKSDFYQESNWHNFVIMDKHRKANGVSTGWVRLGLVASFVPNGTSGNKMKVKRPQFPVIHPVHHRHNRTYLSYHNSSDNGDVTYFRFVAPLDSSNHQGGKYFSLCVRRLVNENDIDGSLAASLGTDDLFLVYKEKTTEYGRSVGAELVPLRDIDNPSMAVFARRSPDSVRVAIPTSGYIYFRYGNTITNPISTVAPKSNFNPITVPSYVDNVVVPGDRVLNLFRDGEWDDCQYASGTITSPEDITHWNHKPRSSVANSDIC